LNVVWTYVMLDRDPASCGIFNSKLIGYAAPSDEVLHMTMMEMMAQKFQGQAIVGPLQLLVMYVVASLD
jgi:hypothetical protein